MAMCGLKEKVSLIVSKGLFQKIKVALRKLQVFSIFIDSTRYE